MGLEAAMTHHVPEVHEPGWTSPNSGGAAPGQGIRGLQLRSYLTNVTCAVVFVGGHLDSTSADRLHDYVRRIIDRPSSIVLIDLSELMSCDERGLNSLIRIRDHAASARCEVVLAESPSLITRILHPGRHHPYLTLLPRPDHADGR
jgi:anti-anti-sigma regulatory factor